MGQSTEELTSDIEDTRRNLSQGVDELTDKVDPHRVIERRKQATRGKLTSIKDKVMGTAAGARETTAAAGSSAGQSASSAVGSVSEGAHSSLTTVEQRTEGNPLAAGLVAFGAGMLISSLLPASRQEATAAGSVMATAKEHKEPVMEEARSMAGNVGEELKSSAGDAADKVRTTAQQSAASVKQQGQSSAQRVKDDTRQQSG